MKLVLMICQLLVVRYAGGYNCQQVPYEIAKAIDFLQRPLEYENDLELVLRPVVQHVFLRIFCQLRLLCY